MSVEVTRLSNGLTIATENMPTLESAALGIWVKAGARDEAEGEHGIAHLLEHMAFKGTNRRSARRIAEEIEDVGGELNASTSVETTAYYARVMKDDVPLAIDILTDILIDSRFDEDELAREQHVILQEIGAAEDTPDDIVFDHFQSAAYQGQILGRPILGTRESVSGFTPDRSATISSAIIRPTRWWSRPPAPCRTTTSCAASRRRSVRRLPPRTVATCASPPSTPAASSARSATSPTRRWCSASRPPLYQRDFYAAQVLSIILGGGMSSRLFQEIRETRGLCYAISAFHWSFSDTGIFGIHAATGEEEMAELAPVIVSELLRATEGITEKEVGRARAQMRSSLLMSQESPASRAGQIARQLMFKGSVLENGELLDRLAAIDSKRLTDLSAATFLGTTPTLAAIGPISRLPHVGEIAGEATSDANPSALRTLVSI